IGPAEAAPHQAGGRYPATSARAPFIAGRHPSSYHETACDRDSAIASRNQQINAGPSSLGPLNGRRLRTGYLANSRHNFGEGNRGATTNRSAEEGERAGGRILGTCAAGPLRARSDLGGRSRLRGGAGQDGVRRPDSARGRFYAP